MSGLGVGSVDHASGLGVGKYLESQLCSIPNGLGLGKVKRKLGFDFDFDSV